MTTNPEDPQTATIAVLLAAPGARAHRPRCAGSSCSAARSGPRNPGRCGRWSAAMTSAPWSCTCCTAPSPAAIRGTWPGTHACGAAPSASPTTRTAGPPRSPRPGHVSRTPTDSSPASAAARSRTSLHESGNGKPYTPPTSGYFKLPFAYWTSDEDWSRTLSLAAKAVLLTSLSLTSPFSLPAERAPQWYSMSADTMNRGQIELRRRKVLSRRFETVVNWTSPTGFTNHYKFALRKPFARRPAGAGPDGLIAPAAVAP